MAREINVEQTRREPEPHSTEEAVRAIDETRDRISRDLDAIEARLEARKDQVEATAERVKRSVDVLTPTRHRIRERPLPSLGIALGAGLILGLLSGGGEELDILDEEERKERRRWRAERRTRIRERGRERARRRPPEGDEGEPVARRFARTLLASVGSAVLAGLATRARTLGTELAKGTKAGRSARTTPRATGGRVC